MNGDEHERDGARGEDGQLREKPQTTVTTKYGVKMVSWTAPEGEELVIDLDHLDELGKACTEVAKDPEQLELTFDQDGRPKAAPKGGPLA